MEQEDNLPEGWKSVRLGQLLEESEFERVETILRKPNSDAKWKELRKYLNSIKKNLRKKGVLADYLYHILKAKFEGNFDIVEELLRQLREDK